MANSNIFPRTSIGREFTVVLEWTGGEAESESDKGR